MSKDIQHITIPFTGAITLQIPSDERLEGNREPYTKQTMVEVEVNRFNRSFEKLAPEEPRTPGVRSAWIRFDWNDIRP